MPVAVHSSSARDCTNVHATSLVRVAMAHEPSRARRPARTPTRMPLVLTLAAELTRSCRPQRDQRVRPRRAACR